MGCCIKRKEEQVSISITNRHQPSIKCFLHNTIEEVVVVDNQKSLNKSMKRTCNKVKNHLPMNTNGNKHNYSPINFTDDIKDNQSVVIDDNISIGNQLENQLTKALKEFNCKSINFSYYLQGNCSKTISHRVFVNNDLIDKSSNCNIEKSLTTRKMFSKSFNFNNNELIFNNNEFKESLSFYPKFSSILQKESENNIVTPSIHKENNHVNNNQIGPKRSISTNINFCIKIINLKDLNSNPPERGYNVF